MRLKASDARAAIPILQLKWRIDLLVTDVGLPNVNGRRLAEPAREAQPDLRVLFNTGYAENAAVRGGFLAAGMDMLSKPFALDTLGAKIREMIKREPGVPKSSCSQSFMQVAAETREMIEELERRARQLDNGRTGDGHGCSTLSTDAPLGNCIEPGERSDVSVLAERSGLITAQYVVAEAADPGEHTWVMTDARLILLEGDVAGVM